MYVVCLLVNCSRNDSVTSSFRWIPSNSKAWFPVCIQIVIKGHFRNTFSCLRTSLVCTVVFSLIGEFEVLRYFVISSVCVCAADSRGGYASNAIRTRSFVSDKLKWDKAYLKGRKHNVQCRIDKCLRNCRHIAFQSNCILPCGTGDYIAMLFSQYYNDIKMCNENL